MSVMACAGDVGIVCWCVWYCVVCVLVYVVLCGVWYFVVPCECVGDECLALCVFGCIGVCWYVYWYVYWCMLGECVVM